MAVSDPTGTIATPLPTLTIRTGRRLPLARLRELGREYGISHVVAGLPLKPDGSEDEWCAEVRAAGLAVAKGIGAELAFVDERMTSVRAEAAVRALGLRKKDRERRDRVDRAAAQLILQSWLDRGGGEGK